MRKIIILLVVLMFLITGFATISNSKENKAVEKIDNANKLGYKGCYIAASGKISEEDWFAIIRMPNMWKTFWFRPPLNEQEAFVSFWRIIYQSDSEVTIYTEENGDILWDYNGQEDVNLIIIGFNGIYIPDRSNPDEPLHVEISGNALFVKPRLI
jgi:hypothetical protein